MKSENQKKYNMDLLSIVSQNISISLIACVLLGGIFAKNYTSSLKISNAHKTLLLGSLFAVLYLGALYISGNFHKSDVTKYFFSYCVATSLYELLLKYAFEFLYKKLGMSPENNTPPKV